MSKILIAYFSRKGQNYVSGSIKNLTVGNTELVAKIIQQEVGGDLFEIESVSDYPEDYTKCTEVAQDEKRKNVRPALTARIDNIGNYDTVILGYPNWWSTMPMPVYTFLENYDFSGKTILPYCTHEGSGISGTERDIQKECPNATVKKGLAIHGTKAASSLSDVQRWLKSNL